MNEIGPAPGAKRVIYGEGAVAPIFMGSVYMKNFGESDEQAAWRFNESLKSLGFEWLGEHK